MADDVSGVALKDFHSPVLGIFKKGDKVIANYGQIKELARRGKVEMEPARKRGKKLANVANKEVAS